MRRSPVIARAGRSASYRISVQANGKGTQPGTQERPKAFHRIDMHFTKPVPIVITGVFTRTMTDGFVSITPLW